MTMAPNVTGNRAFGAFFVFFSDCLAFGGQRAKGRERAGRHR